MNTFLLALLLGTLNGLSIVLGLSGCPIPFGSALSNGLITGLLVGDPMTGLSVGSQCLLYGIGYYTYGGATTPNFTTGAMFGTVVAAQSGSLDSGLAVAVSIALLMSEMDILGRSTTTVFQHLGDKALANNNIKKFETWTLLGVTPWFLSRFLPVFLGMLMIGEVSKLAEFANRIQWIANGLAAVGKILPAVGFALLLSYMDLRHYWPFAIIGFILFAYCGVGTLGLALVGLAAGVLYTGLNKTGFSMKGGNE